MEKKGVEIVRKVQNINEMLLDKRVYELTTGTIGYFCFKVCPVFGTEIRYIDLDKIPISGHRIVVCTHESFLDIPILSLISKDFMRYVAKIELFKFPVSWWLDRVGAIPVNRKKPGSGTIKRSIQVILSKDILVIFPEGKRIPSIDGKKDFSQIEEGVASIALRCKCEPKVIIPVVIKYSNKKNILGLPKLIIVKIGNSINVTSDLNAKSLTSIIAHNLEVLYNSIKQ